MKWAYLALLMIALGSVRAEGAIFNGSKVYIDTPQAYVSADPAVVQGSSSIDIEFKSKVSDVDVTAAFCFNKSYLVPRELYYYNPHNDTYETSYTCTGTFNFTTNPNHFWCYQNGTLNIEHDFTKGNVTTKTAWWNDTRESDWRKIQGNFIKRNVSYDGKDTCYILSGIPLEANVTYRTRVVIDAPIIPLGRSQESVYPGFDSKYGVAFFPSSYGTNISGAIANNVFFYLDPEVLLAVGGTITTVGFNSTHNYKVHTYTSNGTFNVTSCTNCTIEVLVVAGGGSGADGVFAGAGVGSGSGGGGGGGVVYNNSYTITAGTNYNVTVGIGGLRISGENGLNSSFGTLHALGGGQGGNLSNGQAQAHSGGTGGSGGGASGGNIAVNASTPNPVPGGTNYSLQGLRGGNGTAAGGNGVGGGGGGGCGSHGINASGSTANGGNGGRGCLYNLTGTPTNYSGGGGGVGWNVGLAGNGSGGGGNGNNSGMGRPGVNGTGGGGGGGDATGGGRGGDGIVIIRYLDVFYNVTIKYPNTTNVRLVNATSNLSFNFTATESGVNLTNANTLTILNISIDGLSCPVNGEASSLQNTTTVTGLGNWTTTNNPAAVVFTTIGNGGFSDDADMIGGAGAQLNLSGFNTSNIPVGSVILGITLEIEHAASSNTGTNELFFAVWNGSAWSAQNTTGDENTADDIDVFGGPQHLWGLAWTNISKLSVNLTSGATSTRTMNVDNVRININYSYETGSPATLQYSCNAAWCDVNCTPPQGLTGLQDLYLELNYTTTGIRFNTTSTNSLNYGTTIINYCYQEHANVTPNCGGSKTGKYNFSGDWTNSGNTIDGDYATFGISPNLGATGFLSVNYTKPGNVTNLTLWQVKDNGGTFNLSINNSNCWTSYPTKLVLRVNSTNPVVNREVNWACHNTTAWVLLRQHTGVVGDDADVFEEGVFWEGLVNTSCIYSGGSWTVQCSENCVLSYNEDLEQNNIIFNGTGEVKIRANITNVGQGYVQNACYAHTEAGGTIW